MSTYENDLLNRQTQYHLLEQTDLILYYILCIYVWVILDFLPFEHSWYLCSWKSQKYFKIWKTK